MSVRVERLGDDGSVNMAHLQGRMDAYTCQGIFESLKARITSDSPNLVLDLSGLELLASSGIGIILKLQGRVEGLGGEFVICNSSTIVQKVMDVMKMSDVMTIYETSDEALQHFGLLDDSASHDSEAYEEDESAQDEDFAGDESWEEDEGKE